eukprot:scaffold97024_cov26-Tisochrysis_lutea.AAC.5
MGANRLGPIPLLASKLTRELESTKVSTVCNSASIQYCACATMPSDHDIPSPAMGPPSVCGALSIIHHHGKRHCPHWRQLECRRGPHTPCLQR